MYFLAVLGLCCFTQAFSICDEQASHCGGFSCGAWALGRGLSTCGTQA